MKYVCFDAIGLFRSVKMTFRKLFSLDVNVTQPVSVNDYVDHMVTVLVVHLNTRTEYSIVAVGFGNGSSWRCGKKNAIFLRTNFDEFQ